MTKVKYLHWFAILVLLVTMILIWLLGSGVYSLWLLIPIAFYFILIRWAKSLEERRHDESYSYYFENIFLFLTSIIALFPIIFISIFLLPYLVQQLPEYYTKENRIERRLEKLASKRFKRFKKMKAPIENGIWIEQHEMQQPYDFDGTYVVPCVNGQIHGEVKMEDRNDWQRSIYFNQGKIDSILSKENERIYSKSYSQKDDNYLKINYFQNDNGQISIDTFVINRREVESHFWEQ
ncbi:MAG: hypothetical protein AB8G11_04080 [Saprospiraceae bacterium]